MINYSNWQRKPFSVTSLKLDSENPRLPRSKKNLPLSQPEIINYLVEEERVYELAKAIATIGYFLNEEPIVYKNGSKYIVLEGNRRIAACKILLNPNLLKSGIKKKNIEKLLEKFDISSISKLHCRVSPSREAADVLIFNRHNEGAPIEKWDKTKQDRFLYLRVNGGETVSDLALKFHMPKSDIKGILSRYNMYIEILKYDFEPKDKSIIEDESKFTMTTVERFYKSKLGREFLGIDFDEKGGLIHNLPKEEFKKRFMRVVSDVARDILNSRTYGDESAQKKYIEGLKLSKQFNLSVRHKRQEEKELKVDIVEEAEPELGREEVHSSNRSSTPKTKLIPSEIRWKTGVARIDKIFKELKSAHVVNQFNSTAVLFRSYLDMIVYQYLYANGSLKEIISEEQKKLDDENIKRYERLIAYIVSLGIKESKIQEKELKKAIRSRNSVSIDWVPSLKHMLTYLAKSEILLPDAKLRQALGSYIKGSDSFLDHNDYNLLVHNEYFFKDGEDLKRSWNQMFALVEYINNKLQTKR